MNVPPGRDFDEEYRTLCGAAGHLFLQFARLEGTLSAMLRLHLAKCILGEPSENIALSSSIYGSMRYKTSRDTIKRIMTAQNTEKNVKEFVESIFAHIGEIESLRDIIAHHQTTPASEGSPYWQSTDALTTRSIDALKVYIITPKFLATAADDLVIATQRLGNRPPDGKLYALDGFDFSPVAWRYKPSMLKLVHQNKMRNPQSPSI